MAFYIGFLSQKGGVGKSTLSKMIAREFAVGGWEVKIADMDTSQGTSFFWNSRRLTNNIQPLVRVEQFRRVEDALKASQPLDLMVFDGAPHATKETLQIAKTCHLVVLPTGISLDDLEPTVRLAHELKHEGVPAARIVFALCRVGNSEVETSEARNYLSKAGYQVLDGEIPERTGYRRASDMGRTLTETTHSTLNKQADRLAQSIVNHFQKATEE